MISSPNREERQLGENIHLNIACVEDGDGVLEEQASMAGDI